ncbi:MAG TPA: GNAT family N-acetyltransferase [Actinocrinis sp.]|jgi:predicted GNAT family acetyltransferase
MPWRITESLAEFEAAAGGFLAADPVRNTLLLTIPAALRRRGMDAFGDAPPRFGWFARSGSGPAARDLAANVRAAFVQTPPHPLVLGAAPPRSAAALAVDLCALDTPVSSINAPTRVAESFAKAWCARTGARPIPRIRMRLYQLETLRAPDPPPRGRARTAAASDRALITRWYGEFADEAEPSREAAGSRRPAPVVDQIAHRSITLWEADGEPVSLAYAGPPAFGVSRIGPVYTPPSARRQGFAAAVTAAACLAASGAGAAEVVLFTDLDNPTSNGVYQRIGFRPVEDRALLDLEAG